MRTLTLAALLIALAPAAARAGGTHEHAATTTPADLQRMLDLTGTWTGTSQDGHAVTQTLETVSNGTTVLERFLDASNPQFSNMVTLYYMDNGRLALTHYCSVPNEPRMMAQPYDPATKALVFECVGGGNMKSHDEGHMHKVVLRLEAPDRLTTEWTYRDKGKDVFTEVVHLTRTGPAPAAFTDTAVR